jgi:hypothetical protein
MVESKLEAHKVEKVRLSNKDWILIWVGSIAGAAISRLLDAMISNFGNMVAPAYIPPAYAGLFNLVTAVILFALLSFVIVGVLLGALQLFRIAS